MRHKPVEESADARIAAIAGRQGGVISVAQLLAAGLDRSAIARRVRRGVDVTVGRGGRERRSGLRIHRTALDDNERTSIDGLPITTVERTLLDISGGHPARDARTRTRAS